jgi:hypothetical protein
MKSESEIMVRNAQINDYPSFYRMEEEAWKNSGIEVISRDIFETWINVFQEGFLVADLNGQIVGHMYGQICDFDPFDETDNRDLYTMTDNMYTERTHDPRGNCYYSFSVSCTHGNAFFLLNEKSCQVSMKYNKQYYAGAVRMPGLERYLGKNGLQACKKVVHEYASKVRDTARRLKKGEQKVFDPVVSPILLRPGSQYARVIENFFPFTPPQDWGCVLVWPNPDYKLHN